MSADLPTVPSPQRSNPTDPNTVPLDRLAAEHPGYLDRIVRRNSTAGDRPQCSEFQSSV